MTPAIVVLAYKRPLALQRLLDALQSAEYWGTPTLVISLEGEADRRVVEIAEAFASEKLHVRVIRRRTRVGLREHVIACGDLSDEYGSVIILEDDLLVDRYFYIYACQALAFYNGQKAVAGIALYGYQYNEVARLPFTPMANGHDTYPMQIACSWGQCWTYEQWAEFKTWYNRKSQDDLERIDYLPRAVKDWPESSWKKYFHGFMVERGKYFIYPYQSYSTNCSDSGGTHVKVELNIFQVTLPSPFRPRPGFVFCPITHKEVVYDSFMEPCGDFIWRTIGLSEKDVEIDIQGSKPLSILKRKTHAVTLREAKKKERTYFFGLRPIEFNLVYTKTLDSGEFWLCSTISLEDNDRALGSLPQFNYYARMNLMRRDILAALLRFLPKKLLIKILGVKVR